MPPKKPPVSELAETLHAAEKAAAQARKLAEAGDTQAALKASTEATRLGQRAGRIAQGALSSKGEKKRRTSARGWAISAVGELEVASSPKEIASYVSARFGEPFDLRGLASVRRDERRAWQSPGRRRSRFLVPTLEGPWLVAGRGRYALSDWDLWRRIIGPLSHRVDHLRATDRLLAQYEWATENDSQQADRLRRLVVEYAASVPGALRDRFGDTPIEGERIREAIAAELGLMSAEDRFWREQQAERARRLPEEQQLWGAPTPHVVQGGG